MATLEKHQDLTESHWYTRDGQPAYTVPRAKGDGERATTLRDARKLDLLPSVTTIFQIMAKPGLDKWKLGKAIEAALDTPRDAGEPEEHWHERILARSREEVLEAADLGSRIHDAIDNWFGGQMPPVELEPYVMPALCYFNEKQFTEVEREKVVINSDMGYGGRVDLLARAGGKRLIVDFKTRRTEEGVKVTPYDFQPMQIAAYARAAYGTLYNVYGANIYLSTTEPGRMEIVDYKPEQLQAEYDAFTSMCALWRYQKRYDPRAK